MNPIIVIDLKEALVKPRPFIEAHKRWFKLFSILLEDDSINDWAKKENYFEGVHTVMSLYLKDSEKEFQTIFARQMFSMVLVAEITPDDLVKDFADYLRTIKDRYILALITTVPEDSIAPLLNKLGCGDLFELIYPSLNKNHPDKKTQFIDFIQNNDTPLFYIGYGDKLLGELKDLNINTISVNWISKGTFRGDYEVYSVDELKQIL
jgi:phosphoglycolate phosphatase-like HAD superfamily hydrolase